MTVTNGSGKSRTGPVWTFTTGSGGPVNQPPTADSQSVTTPGGFGARHHARRDRSRGRCADLLRRQRSRARDAERQRAGADLSARGELQRRRRFTFRVSDGRLNSNIATVSIAVQPVNDPPSATAESYTRSGRRHAHGDGPGRARQRHGHRQRGARGAAGDRSGQRRAGAERQRLVHLHAGGRLLGTGRVHLSRQRRPGGVRCRDGRPDGDAGAAGRHDGSGGHDDRPGGRHGLGQRDGLRQCDRRRRRGRRSVPPQRLADRSRRHGRAIQHRVELDERRQRPLPALRASQGRRRQPATSAAVSVTVNNGAVTGLVAAYSFNEGTGTTLTDGAAGATPARSLARRGPPRQVRGRAVLRRRERLGHNQRHCRARSDDRHDARSLGDTVNAERLADGAPQGTPRRIGVRVYTSGDGTQPSGYVAAPGDVAVTAPAHCQSTPGPTSP